MLQVFHAGTTTNDSGHVTAAGGRVLGVTATGRDVAEAQRKAYEVRAGAVGTYVLRPTLWCGTVGLKIDAY